MTHFWDFFCRGTGRGFGHVDKELSTFHPLFIGQRKVVEVGQFLTAFFVNLAPPIYGIFLPIFFETF